MRKAKSISSMEFRIPLLTFRVPDQQIIFDQLLTIAPPDLSQVAAALAGLFAELDDIPARRLGSDGHLSHGLFPITEVYCQYHLGDRHKHTNRGEGRKQ